MHMCKLHEIVKDREAWHAAVHGVTKRHDWVTDNNNNAPIELPAYKIQESPKLTSSWHQMQNSAVPKTTLISDTNYKFPRLPQAP